MRYYSLHRPIGPGTYPKADHLPVEEIHNFGERVFCPEIGRMAWGYIDYAGKLPELIANKYELVPEGRKIWYCVVSSYFDDGLVIANIVDEKESFEKPENISSSLRRKYVYFDWFDDYEEAQQFVEEARKT